MDFFWRPTPKKLCSFEVWPIHWTDPWISCLHVLGVLFYFHPCISHPSFIQSSLSFNQVFTHCFLSSFLHSSMQPVLGTFYMTSATTSDQMMWKTECLPSKCFKSGGRKSQVYQYSPVWQISLRHDSARTERLVNHTDDSGKANGKARF